ncbi:hypothetical protein BR93DRAFT_886059 [Coniochaeta sp. PMI_546]|nr:hypothetical protein BR93DRAFT_886059 [Coniochaeta sp. PMI_546]
MSITMSSARDPTARLRAGLNPLLTASLGVYHPNQTNTPLSAVSMASGSHSSLNGFSSAQTPVSAIQPYNPQQWIASPVPGHPERPSHPYQESQPSPPPPPPYSPPRSQRPPSMSFDAQQVANISAARAPPPPSIQQRPSPEVAPITNTTFAPPPGTRGASRERRFGLPSFGRRRETEQTSNSPESYSNAHTPIHHAAPHPLSVSSRPHALHQAPLTLQIPTRSDSDSSQNLPPGARRAVSTPAVASPISARSRSSSQVRWDQPMGMQLPPPPPGPPPASSRSQSVSRAGENGAPVMSPPTRRPPPIGVTALGPVPPTPQNWTNDENDPPQREPSPIRTSEELSVTSTNPPESAISSSTSQASSAAGLARARALRSEKSLLQRRSESRTRGGVHNSIDASLDVQPLSDIVIPSGSGGLSRRLTINRGTPRSGRAGQITPQTADTVSSSEASHESGSTPRALSSATTQEGPETPTPPFSPQPRRARATPEPHPSIAPKALPTPPPQSRSSSRTPLRSRESSHPAPLSPSRPLTRQIVISQSVEQFSRATIDRFTLFAEKEALAADDAERVRLFAEFFVNESRIRRERYSSAISAMGSEIFDLSRDLFRPMPQRRESAVSSTASAGEFTPQTSEPPRSHRGSTGSHTVRDSPIQSNTPSSANAPSPSPSGTNQGQNWQSSNYMPSLSPILSMSASSALDEEDSRGRPASRWWEADSNGEPVRMERSKRESKYMGVPKEAREALQYMDAPEASSSRQPVHDYPPEKAGWHEEEQVRTPLQLNPLRNSLLSLSSPNTPNPAHLDCSRLVTLPPPYPRHHPAVNNNHPELTKSRDAVRILSDMTQVETTKAQFLESSAKLRAEAAEEAKQRIQALRQNLQQEISTGNIGYAEAAGIEADAKLSENAKAKELEKKDFEDFQSVVVMPLNDLLTSRIATATALFDELRGRLFSDTHSSNPNMPQEEGDEQPELLEKLTLLKWIFESREHLHRAIYDILTDRNDRYREMVLTPYRLSGNADKVASATAFFAEDAAKRSLAFSEEVLHRTQEFRDVVEETVVRGVEAQLGAFWDIAPALKRLLDKIPLDMRGFAIQIPASEYEENPAYVDHPMQYLFSLLLHAEKSTYQFIESQTNLLCLLHEVKEAVVMAKAKVMEQDGRDEERVEEMKRAEMGRLTDDLKEKVRVVQEQWKDALGEGITLVKERLGEWLLETGGWDESLEDEGVGGVQI